MIDIFAFYLVLLVFLGRVLLRDRDVEGLVLLVRLVGGVFGVLYHLGLGGRFGRHAPGLAGLHVGVHGRKHGHHGVGGLHLLLLVLLLQDLAVLRDHLDVVMERAVLLALLHLFKRGLLSSSCGRRSWPSCCCCRCVSSFSACYLSLRYY